MGVSVTSLKMKIATSLVVALVALFAHAQAAPSRRNAENFIVGGRDVNPVGKWPHQASLQQNNRHICGASLISTRWLVTAAHCVGSSSYTVVLGMHDQRGYYGSPRRYTVSRVTKHPWYSQNNGYPNDIAMLQLSSAAQLNSYVKTIPMAPSNAPNFQGYSCYISGWGQTASTSSPNTLQEAPVDVYTTSYCRSYLGSSINDKQICVGDKGTSSACYGDSGGPLVCYYNGAWTLAGATSWGKYNCPTSSPAVYTRISAYRDWIRSISGV